MKLELDIYSAMCETQKFAVNGIDATYRDFGVKYDSMPDDLKPGCCGNMVFVSVKPAQEVLSKYGITIKDYNNICELLRASISFGTCRLCG